MKPLARALILWTLFWAVYQPITSARLWVDVQRFVLPSAAWAGPMEDAANAGYTFGQYELHGPVTDGTNIYYDGASGTTSTGVTSLFPAGGAVDETSQVQGNFGDHAAQQTMNAATANRLTTEDSVQGEAYRAAMTGFQNSTRPNMLDDSVFNVSKALIDGDDPIYDQFFAGCTETTTTHEGTSSIHIPDYYKCERFVDMSMTCEWFHDFGLPTTAPDMVVPNGMTEESCGDWCVLLTKTVDADPDSYMSPSFSWPSYGFSIADPNRVTSIAVTHTFDPAPVGSWRCEHNSLCEYGDSYFDFYLDFDGYFNASSSEFSLYNEDHTDDLRAGGFFYAETTTSWWEECDRLEDLLCVWGPRYWHRPGGFTTTVEIQYEPISNPTFDDGWRTTSQECRDSLSRVNWEECEGTTTCLVEQPTSPSGCYELPEIKICPANMVASPLAGISPFCRHATLAADCTAFYRGEFECFVDHQGVTRCPTNNGENTDPCAPYRADPNCTFVGSQCIAQGTDHLGVCIAHEETYDCGHSETISDPSEFVVTDCAGPISCMGESCVTQPRETNTDFARVSAALQAVNFTAMEMAHCSNAATCRVFEGDALECKKAFFGWVDCCERPTGISIVDYFQLAMASWWAVKRSGGLEMLASQGLDIPGAWRQITSPVSAVWSEVKKPFVSAYESLAQTVTGSSAQTVDLSLSVVKTAATDSVAQFVASVFGTEARSLLFQNVGGQWVLNSTLSAALSVIMWVYTLYTILKILVHLIWECEESEFEMGAKRELGVCQELGSYCASDTFFGCVEKHEVACCFNSPLGRIIHQRGRSQLGIHWGSAEHPNCRGMTIPELASLDWDTPQMQAGLNEWLGLLIAGGVVPSTQTAQDIDYSLNNATTSPFGAASQPNAVERATERSQHPSGDIDATYETLRDAIVP